MKRNSFAMALLGITVISTAACSQSNPLTGPSVASALPASIADNPTAPIAAATPMDFSAIVAKYGPTVVNISVTSQEKLTSLPIPQGIDPNDPFFEFFKRFAPGLSFPQEAQPRVMRE